MGAALLAFARLLGGAVMKFSLKSFVTQLTRLLAVFGISDIYVRVTQPSGGVLGGVSTALHGVADPSDKLTIPADVKKEADKLKGDITNTIILVGVGAVAILLLLRR